MMLGSMRAIKLFQLVLEMIDYQRDIRLGGVIIIIICLTLGNISALPCIRSFLRHSDYCTLRGRERRKHLIAGTSVIVSSVRTTKHQTWKGQQT